MTSPDHQGRQPRPLSETVRQSADPCFEHLGRLASELSRFGTPEGMYRIGEIRGVQYGTYTEFPQPLPALVPGPGEGHIEFPGIDRDYEAVRALITQAVSALPPGTVRIDVYNPHMTDAFQEFAGLPANLFNLIQPGGLKAMLDDYAAHVMRLRGSNAGAGTYADPWRMLVLAGQGGELDANARDVIDKIMHTGAGWGSVVSIGAGLDENPWLRKGWPEILDVRLDPPLTGDAISYAVEEVGEAANRLDPVPLESVIPPYDIGGHSAIKGIQVTLGAEDGAPFDLLMGDEHTNIMVTGAIGSGKTVLLKTLLGSIARRYAPDEVEVMMLDYKGGGDFARMTPGVGDETFIPNLRFVGSNLHKDHEFGIEALRHVQERLNKRAALSKQLGCEARYDILRANAPEGTRLPRILLGIDELQVLLQGAHGPEAVAILEDIARRGRSLGVHMIWGTQSLGGIESLFTKKDSIISQFRTRIAGQGGDLGNPLNTGVVENLPRLHYAVNTNGGAPGGERIVRAAAAFGEAFEDLQRDAWRNRRPADPEPVGIDVDRKPSLEESSAYAKLKPRKGDKSIIVASEYDLRGGAASFKFSRQPGRNMAVVGQRPVEVASTMDTAVRSLVKQVQPEEDKISLVCLDPVFAESVSALAEELAEKGQQVEVVGKHEARNFFASANVDLDADSAGSHYVFVYGVDSASEVMDTTPKIRQTFVVPPDVKPDVGREYRENAHMGLHKGPNDLVAKPYNPPIKAKFTVVGVEEGEEGNTVTYEQELTTGRDELLHLVSNGSQRGTHLVMTANQPDTLKEALGGAKYGSTAVKSVGGYVSFGVMDSTMTSFLPGSVVSAKLNTVEEWRGRFADNADGGAQKLRTVIPYMGPSVRIDSDTDEEEVDTDY